MNKKDIIKACKAYAEAHYTEGYDTFVECYDTNNWEAYLVDVATIDDALAEMASTVEVLNDRRADAAHYEEDRETVIAGWVSDELDNL